MSATNNLRHAMRASATAVATARVCIAAVSRRACSTARSSLDAPHQALYDVAAAEVRSRASLSSWPPAAYAAAASHTSPASSALGEHVSMGIGGGASAQHVRSLTGLFAFAVLAGVGAYYTANTSTRKDIPADVAEFAMRAEELLSAGAPASAAAQFERAVNVLSARGGEPLVVLELLVRMGDAQRAAKYQQRAQDTYERARALCDAILSLEESAPLPCPVATARTWDDVRKDAAAAARLTTSRADVPRMLVAILDRIAELHLQAKRVADAARYYELSVGIVATHHGDMIRRAHEFSASLAAAARTDGGSAAQIPAPFNRKTRHHVADFAGMYYNASACAAEQLRIDSAKEAAATSLRLIGTARAAAVADARVLLLKHEHGAGDDADVEQAPAEILAVDAFPADLRALVLARVADDSESIMQRLRKIGTRATDGVALSIAKDLHGEVVLLSSLQKLAEVQYAEMVNAVVSVDHQTDGTTI